MEPGIVVGIVVAAAVGGVFAYRADRKRRRLLRHWARSRGLRLHRDSRKGWDREHAGLKILGRGRQRRSAMHLHGELGGHPVDCLDYRFVTGSGKNRRTHRYAIVIMKTVFPLIPLQIRRENALDKVTEFFGHDDIDFESAEFSRTFYVTASDRKWAYDVIHARTMEYLLDAPHCTVEFGFGEIAVYKAGFLSAGVCEEATRMARRLLDLIPPDILPPAKGQQP